MQRILYSVCTGSPIQDGLILMERGKSCQNAVDLWQNALSGSVKEEYDRVLSRAPAKYEKYERRRSRSLGKNDIYVCRTYNCAWITNPKVASTLIRSSLTNDERDSKNDFLLERLGKDIPKLTSDALSYVNGLFTFAFVRDPGERFLSAYKNKILRPLVEERFTPQLAHFLEFLSSNPEFFATRISSSLMNYLGSMPVAEWDRHFRPQYLVLNMKQVNYDYLGRIESFENEWENICEQIGAPFEEVWSSLCAENEVKNKKSRINADLNSGEFDWIYRMYKSDYEMFGYCDKD